MSCQGSATNCSGTRNLGNQFCIIWGATGHSKVVGEILRTDGCQLIHIFDNNELVASPFVDVPISYGESGFIKFVQSLEATSLTPRQIDCVAAVGGSNGRARETLTKFMCQFGFQARSIVHRSAVISDSAIIGSSSQILSGAIVGPSARLGDFTIVNSGACIDHDCIIGECSHIAPMATLTGEVKLGSNVFIGANATILPRVSIGCNSIVGAGAVVTKSLGDSIVAVGTPAREIARRQNP